MSYSLPLAKLLSVGLPLILYPTTRKQVTPYVVLAHPFCQSELNVITDGNEP